MYKQKKTIKEGWMQKIWRMAAWKKIWRKSDWLEETKEVDISKQRWTTAEQGYSRWPWHKEMESMYISKSKSNKQTKRERGEAGEREGGGKQRENSTKYSQNKWLLLLLGTTLYIHVWTSNPNSLPSVCEAVSREGSAHNDLTLNSFSLISYSTGLVGSILSV